MYHNFLKKIQPTLSSHNLIEYFTVSLDISDPLPTMTDFDALCQYMVDSESESVEDQMAHELLEGTFLERLEEEFHDFDFKQVEEAHFKGCALHAFMLADNKAAGQLYCPKRKSAESEFQSVADLQRFGYAEEPTLPSPQALVEMKIGLVLELIGLDPCFLPKVSHGDSADVNDDCPPEGSTGTNIAIGHSIILEHPVSPGKPGPPILSYFLQVVNPVCGMLVAQDNLSPLEAYRSENFEEFDLPDLRFWSDVAFLQWKSQASEDSELKHVLRYNVTNYTTNFVVEAINEANCCKTLPWPGVDYDVASEEGKALLGTPNGSSTAYMLVQHKQQLGNKTVDKITVFEHSRELMLLFHVVDVEV
jgi:hypothetical protein